LSESEERFSVTISDVLELVDAEVKEMKIDVIYPRNREYASKDSWSKSGL